MPEGMAIAASLQSNIQALGVPPALMTTGGASTPLTHLFSPISALLATLYPDLWGSPQNCLAMLPKSFSKCQQAFCLLSQVSIPTFLFEHLPCCLCCLLYGPTSVPAKAARSLERFANTGCSFSRFGNGEVGRLLEKLGLKRTQQRQRRMAGRKRLKVGAENWERR